MLTTMNLTRVIFGSDIPILITKDFTEVKHFFRNLKEEHSANDEDLSFGDVNAIYLFAYDDRYDVDREMSGDLLVFDKESDEIVEQEHWSERVPWFFYCQPLDLSEFLALNKEYCRTHNLSYLLD